MNNDFRAKRYFDRRMFMKQEHPIRRGWKAAIAGMLALSCLSAAAADTAQSNTTKVLETFSAGGAFQYQLAVEPCVMTQWMECPITVNLFKNSKRVDRKPLPVTAEDQEFKHKLIRPAWTHRLFNNTPELRAWESGYENAYVGVLARTIPLDAKHTGILITQLTGFETLHLEHVLYTVVKGKLKKLWSFFDSAPPTSTAVYPVTHQGRNYLLFWEDRRGYYVEKENYVPHRVRVGLLSWQASKKTVKTIPLPAKKIPLYAVTTRFYPSAMQAQQAIKQEQIKCPINVELEYPQTVDYRPFIVLVILATADYPQLVRQEAAFLGNIFFTREEAQKYQEGLKRCTPAMDSEITLLN